LAIEIEGEFYCNGEFASNPTITPLIRECDSTDMILMPRAKVEGSPSV